MKKNLFLLVLAMLMAVPMMASKKHTETLPTGIKIGGRTSFTFDGSYGYMDNMSLTYYSSTGKKETVTGKIKKIIELSSADKGGNQVWWMPSKNLLLLHNVNLSNIPSLVEATSSYVTIVVSGNCKVNTTGSIGASGQNLTITSLCGIKGADSKTSPYFPTANSVINNDKQKTNKLTMNMPISVAKQLTVGALRLDVRKLKGTTNDARLTMFDLNATNVDIGGFGKGVTSDHCGIQYSEVKNRALVLNEQYNFCWLPINAKKEIFYNDMKRATALNIVAGACSEEPRTDIPLVALRFNPEPGSYGNPRNNNSYCCTVRPVNAGYDIIFTTGFVITLPYSVIKGDKDWAVVPAYSNQGYSTVKSFQLPNYIDKLIGFELQLKNTGQITSGHVYFIPSIGICLKDANIVGNLLNDASTGEIWIYVEGNNTISKNSRSTVNYAIKSKGKVKIRGYKNSKLTLTGMNVVADKTFFINDCDVNISSGNADCIVSQNGEFVCENANVDLYAPKGYTVLKGIGKMITYGCGIYSPKTRKDDITLRSGSLYENGEKMLLLQIRKGKWPSILPLNITKTPWSLKTAVQEYEDRLKNAPQVAQ